MRALVVRGHEGGARSLELAEVPVPAPRGGQVLVRVSSSPVNPNDLLALRGAYDVEKPVGCVAGFEGSGRVVAGTGLLPRFLRGRRVAFAAGEDGGSWAEYVAVDAMRCVPLRAGVDDEQGATMLTNPMTSSVLIERARREGHRAVVQAAAAGALGKMLARLALARGLTMIHVVRSAEQAKAMHELGAEHVLDSSAPGFEGELAARCRKLHATLALDPVGGALTGTLLRALDDGGVVRVYGWLSGAPGSFDTDEVLFRGKRIEGFTMYEWLATTSRFRQFVTVMRVQGLLSGPLATHVRARVPLAEFEAALADSERMPTSGKTLFSPALDTTRS